MTYISPLIDEYYRQTTYDTDQEKLYNFTKDLIKFK